MALKVLLISTFLEVISFTYELWFTWQDVNMKIVILPKDVNAIWKLPSLCSMFLHFLLLSISLVSINGHHSCNIYGLGCHMGMTTSLRHHHHHCCHCLGFAFWIILFLSSLFRSMFFVTPWFYMFLWLIHAKSILFSPSSSLQILHKWVPAYLLYIY